jgi:hypothetical protein
LVSADGRVESAGVAEAPAPFGAAAAAGALFWRFEPARRDGRPVAARIRFTVRFTEQRAPGKGTRSPSSMAPAEPLAPRDVREPTEVVVRGERAAPSAARLTRVESRQLPGAFGDPFRAIEVLPGVTPVASGVPYFIVRGAPPGNVGYFFDGIRVPLLFHVFFGPSVIHPSMIRAVDLYRGGYPAPYGRFAGAVAVAELATPRERLAAELNVRLFDAGALVELPFPDGAGSAILAGRYSYTAAAISVLSNVELDYWDYQTLVTYNLGRSDKASVFAFGSHDYLSRDDGSGLGTSEFHRLDVRYDHAFGEESSSRIAVTLGKDWTADSGSTSTDTLIAPRAEYRGRLGSHALLRAGADASFDAYQFDLRTGLPNYIDLAKLFETRRDRTVGAYAEVAIHPEDWYLITPGVRVDSFASGDEQNLAVDPRISARFEATPGLRFLHAFGSAHQTPNFVPAVPGVHLAGLRDGLQTSWQASSGFEVDLPEDVTGGLTVFENIFTGLSDPLGVSGDFFAHPETAYIRSLGSAVGLELALRRPLTRRLGGILAYTLSRTTRKHGRIDTLAATDRPHVVNLMASYDLGRRWRFGSRVSVASGLPAHAITDDGLVYEGFGRAPALVRLDLRIEKRWVMSERSWWALTAELFNATLGSEVTSRRCSRTGCVDEVIGPITIPSVGVEAAF